MDEENKPVENNEEAGNLEGVEKKEAEAPKPDYEAILQNEVALRLKAEEERENYKRGLLKAKGKIEDDTDDEPTVGELVKQEIARGMEEIKSNLAKASVSSILSQMTTDQGEKNLIKYYYDNRIVKSGVDEEAIRRDLEDARAMANKHKLNSAVEEIKIAKENKQQMSNNSSGSSNSGNEKETRFFSKEQEEHLRQVARQIGVDPEKFIEESKTRLKNLKK